MDEFGERAPPPESKDHEKKRISGAAGIREAITNPEVNLAFPTPVWSANL